MIEPNAQQFLDHCINVLKVDTITHPDADGEQRWDEVATVGGVSLVIEYTDRDYPSDNRVSIKYVVGSDYQFKVPLEKFLTLTRADIENIEQQAAIYHKQYMDLADQLRVFPGTAKKNLQKLLT